MPFKYDHPSLGTSLTKADGRLVFLENKAHIQPECALSSNFMNELGHIMTSPHYFLPHHGVLKESSTSTKLHPVVDANSKTNEVKLTGYKLQTASCDM